MFNGNKVNANEAQIALRAYGIWEAEGKPHGNDFDHWLRAKAELAALKPAGNPMAAGKFVASKA